MEAGRSARTPTGRGIRLYSPAAACCPSLPQYTAFQRLPPPGMLCQAPRPQHAPPPLAAGDATDAAGAADLSVGDVAQAQIIQHPLDGHLGCSQEVRVVGWVSARQAVGQADVA